MSVCTGYSGHRLSFLAYRLEKMKRKTPLKANHGLALPSCLRRHLRRQFPPRRTDFGPLRLTYIPAPTGDVISVMEW